MRELLIAVLVVSGCADDDSFPVSDGGGDGGRDGGPDTGADAALRDGSVDSGPELPELLGPERGFVGEPSCFELTSVSEEVRFVWGDGEQEQANGQACHSYSYPGRFLVSATAGDINRSRAFTVVPRPTDVPPSSSAMMAFDGERVYIASPDAGTVAIIDVEAQTLEELPVCDEPRQVALGDELLAVTCRSDELVLVSRGALQVERRVGFARGALPFAVIHDPRAERFIVGLQGSGQLAIIDGAEVAMLDVGADLRAMAMSGEGLLVVAQWRASSDGARAFRVDLSDIDTPRVLGELVLEVQVGLDSDTDNSGVPSFLESAVFSPSGERVLIGSLKANIVTGLHRTGEQLEDQTTARAIVSELLFDPLSSGGDGEESTRKSFDDLDFASALTLSPFGDRLFVAMLGAQRVIAMDSFSFDVVGSIANVGVAPRALVYDPEREWLFVLADLSRELRIYDVSDLSRVPPLVASVPTLTVEPLEADVLRGKQIFHTSADPRMSRTSYLSCASCHLDGEGDNLVWDFTQRGEGLRNTIVLRGRAGTGHGPMHWTGNFDEVQDFEGDIRNGQGGEGFLEDSVYEMHADPLGMRKAGLSDELDALAAYVESLSELDLSPFATTDAEEEIARGERVAQSAGCLSCHSGQALSDSAPGLRHDVGTLSPASGQRLGQPLDGLDTPTLRGLWSTAPYLHDGSAPTLRDVITTRNSGDLHGNTSTLSAEDLNALERFLLTRE